MPLNREQIAKRIAQEIQPGFVVNLGIGIPTLVAEYIPLSHQVMLHSENGLLGLGPFPFEGEEDADLINAGKQTVTTVAGASFFSSEESFAMIRGGHIDISVLGALQVDEGGSVANWMIPNKMVKGMGGAMDLVAGVQKVILAMSHTDKKQNPKLLKKCNLPLTGVKCVSRVVTDLAVVDIVPEQGFVLKEKVPDITLEELQKRTGASLKVPHPLKPLNP